MVREQDAGGKRSRKLRRRYRMRIRRTTGMAIESRAVCGDVPSVDRSPDDDVIRDVERIEVRVRVPVRGAADRIRRRRLRDDSARRKRILERPGAGNGLVIGEDGVPVPSAAEKRIGGNEDPFVRANRLNGVARNGGYRRIRGCVLKSSAHYDSLEFEPSIVTIPSSSAT